MKKILEIYDISDDYLDYQGNPYIVVLNPQFEADKDTVNKILNSQYTVLTNNEWLDYKNTVVTFNNNDAKHRMRREKPLEFFSSNRFKQIHSLEINLEDNTNVVKAINMLSPQPKRRFIKYYIDGKTYNEIAIEEGKHISSIYESISGARKKFLKYLAFFENTPEKWTPEISILWKGLFPFIKQNTNIINTLVCMRGYKIVSAKSITAPWSVTGSE